MSHRLSSIKALISWCWATSVAIVGSLSILHREPPVPDGWTVCDFIARLADHEPVQFAQSVPAELHGLSPARLLELSEPHEKLQVQATDNGFIGPNNYDHNTLFRAPVADVVRLLDKPGSPVSAYAQGDIAVEVVQSALPLRLQEMVSELLPSWVGFPAAETRLWIDAPGPPRGTFLHNDAYHNMYMMLSGTKTFQLIPPWQSHRVKKVGDPDNNYLAINDYWRWLASSNVSKAHEAWYNMGFDGPGAANLSGTSGVITTLQAGDVLILPRGWWHATMQDGQLPGIAINLWFETRNPMLELWWRMHQQLHFRQGQSLKVVPALRGGTPLDLPETQVIEAGNRLKKKLKERAPWLDFDSADSFESEEDTVMSSGLTNLTAEEGLCIAWEHDDHDTIEANLSAAASKSGVDISLLLKLLSSKRGSHFVSDMLSVSYLRFMGGFTKLPLQAWRRKLNFFYATGSPPLSVDVSQYWQDVDGLVDNALALGVNNHSLFGLVQMCEAEPPEHSPGMFDWLFGATLPAQEAEHPRCEAQYKAGLQSLLRAGSCQITECPKDSSGEKPSKSEL